MKINFNPFKLLVFITLSATFFASCSKDDSEPGYAGTWVDIGLLSNGTTSMEAKEVIIIGNGKFQQTQQIKNPSTKIWTNFFGVKGTYTEGSKRLNITITEAGESTTSNVTKFLTGEIKYYKSSDAEFQGFMEYIDMPATFVIGYEVSGNELTISTDLNGDSDYLDIGEVRTFMRQ